MKIFKQAQFYTVSLVILFLLNSCDVFSVAKILNSSNEEIIIEIQQDKNAIIKEFGKNSYYERTLSMEYGSFSFDSINLISKVKLVPKDSLIIEFGRGKIPQFKFLKKITVFSNDTLILNSREEMLKKFIEKQDQEFIMEIK